MKSLTEPYFHRIQNEVPSIIWEMISDIHQSLPTQNRKLKQAFDDMNTRNIQHLLIMGDITHNGWKYQFQAFSSLLQSYPFDTHLVLGNHDFYHRFHQDAIQGNTLMKELAFPHHLYGMVSYDLCSLYLLNTQKPLKDNAYFEKNQLDWLDSTLADDKHPWKLILCHQPLAGTHPHSETLSMHVGPQSKELSSILKRYQGVVFISGHLHNSYMLPAISLHDSILCINVPAFSDVKQGPEKIEVGMKLALYDTFLHVSYRDYAHACNLDGKSYLYDREKQLLLDHYNFHS